MNRVGTLLSVLALSLVGAIGIAAPAAADTNDFSFSSFSADYFLDRDEDGRSTLRTVETLVAEFPDFPQNRGILRELPTYYGDHPIDIEIESITDETGRDVPWESEEDEGKLTLRIGDADSFALGTTTYVITYTQRNVTGSFANTSDEFYWDTNGTGWPQRFDSVVARVHVPADLVTALSGDAACYRGYEGSTTPCDALLDSEENGGRVFEASSANIAAFENVTVAIGFETGTFIPRDSSVLASPYFYALAFFAILALAAAIWALILRVTVFADADGRPTIVAEYLPPKNASVIMSAVVTGRTKRAVAGQLIDLAVRHHIRIIESPPAGLFAWKNAYTIELLTAEGLEDEARALAAAFFGSSLTPGTQYTMKKSDTVLGQKVYKQLQGYKASALLNGFRRKVPAHHRVLPTLLVLGAGTGAFFSMLNLYEDARGGVFLPALLFVPAVVSALIVFAVVARKPLSEKGAELRDYLRGLLLYIRVAETDRIRILQSPQGAERTPVDTTDRGEMLRLYERVLPYAVLFNEERDWAKQLGDYYDQQPPDWYSGSTAFNAASFSYGIGALAATSTSAFSGSSSSSGGSSGGGSSGGGGGGGGGGGW
jgi:uncharacterized membrane protein YgcG